MSGDFAGFISYSRRASASLAADLQTAVERFAKPWYQLRAVRIFRDDATMSANTALWPAIESALVSAEWLILLTSPAAAASQWVGNEVRWWLEHKSADRILVVLEEGPDLVWDPAADDFDWPHTTNLPPALRGAFGEEPRWIDLRWYEQEGSLEKADPRWPERVADIAAAVRLAERDQLIGENVREHRRARRLLRAGVLGLSLLLVASLVATVIAILQSREADRQADVARAQEREATRQARIALARQLAAQADALAPTDLRTASLLAVQAFRTHDDAQTRATLFQMATASPQLVRTLPVGSRVETAAATPQGVVVTGSADGRVVRWDGAEPTELLQLDDQVFSVAASDDASVVLVIAGTAAQTARATLVRDGVAEPIGEIGDLTNGAVSPDARWIAASGLDGTRLWSVTASGVERAGRIPEGGSNLAFADDELSVVSGSGDWAQVDLAASTYRTGSHFFPIGGLIDVALSADTGTIALFQGFRDYDVWRGPATYADRAANAVAATDLSDSSGIALSADGRRLATFGAGELSIAQVVPRGRRAPRPLRLGGIGSANTDVIAFGGTSFLVTGSGDDALVWDVDQLYRFGREMPATLADGCGLCPLPRVSVSPDGDAALVLDVDGASAVDLHDGRQSALSPDGSTVAAADWLDDGRVLAVTDTGTVAVVEPWTGESQSVASVGSEGGSTPLVVAGDGAADGQATVLLSDGAAVTIDLAGGSVVRRSTAIREVPKEGLARLVAGVAPDQSSAYLGFTPPDYLPTQLAVVDLDRDSVTTTDLPEGVVGAAYDEASRLFVFDGSRAGGLDEDGQLVDPVPAEVTDLPPVVIDDAGTIAVSGGRDGTVHLIDLTRQGAEFGTFAVPQEEASYAVSAFSPDGSRLVTAIQSMPTFGLDSSVRVLSLDPQDWIAAACAVAARDLTAGDWGRYGVGDPPADLRCLR